LCETTEKALEVARHPLIYPDGKPFDLILLDLHMPPPGSFSLIEDIKGMDAQNAKLPVIGMTTQADFSVKEKCRKAGISGFVMKPVDRKKLADEIFRLTRLS
jgi:CheY-like chemotaxis protein